MSRDLWQRSSAPQSLGASPRTEMPEPLWPTCASARPSHGKKLACGLTQISLFQFQWALGPSLGTSEEQLPLAPSPPARY